MTAEMHRPFDPGPRPRISESLLSEIPDSLFDDRIYAACELAERYATDLALAIASRLGLDGPLATGGSAAQLAGARGFDPAFRPAVETLLERLAAAGEIERRTGADGGAVYRRTGPAREPELAGLRATGIGIDPRIVATLDLLDAAAAAWPAVASGRTTGEKELFSAGSIALWLAYFSNDNPVYALNNLLTAVVAANRLPDRDGLSVLEVGAGAGSFTATLLDELARRGRLGRIARYEPTEPSPFFRRRGERELRARFPQVPLTFRALDVDQPFAAQGLPDEPRDLVVGVNVLHVARDLGAALARIREALAPGGWLVAGECLRLFPRQPVPADLVFQLFRSFTDVGTDPVLRPHHGFLEPSAWRTALEAAGFVEVGVVPDLERIRDLYPRFFAGVVVGRRPGVG
jgi:SAM-dependent methyltransferase